MKKLLLFLAFVLVVQTASAQLNDIYLRDGIVLSDNQWHFDDYSVVEAAGNNYLVITPNTYYYRYLPAFRVADFEIIYNDRVQFYKPYIYDNVLGWYVKGAYYNYFYYPETNVCVVLTYAPVFYNFYYHLNRHRHINLRHWHWRPSGRYHYLWKPPHRHRYHHRPHPPQNNHFNKPHAPRNGGYSRPHSQPPGGRSVSPGSRPQSGPSHSRPHSQPPGGRSVSPSSRPQSGPTYSRPQGPPSRGNGDVSRPQGSPSRGSGNVSRPQGPPSRGSSHSGSSSNRGGSGSHHRHR